VKEGGVSNHPVNHMHFQAEWAAFPSRIPSCLETWIGCISKHPKHVILPFKLKVTIYNHIIETNTKNTYERKHIGFHHCIVTRNKHLSIYVTNQGSTYMLGAEMACNRVCIFTIYRT
jgi:hypothetical protein